MNKRTGLGDFILIALEKTVDGYIRLEDFLYNPHLYTTGYDRILKKASLSKALKRLREKGLIDFNTDDQVIFKLTNKGRNLALWEQSKSDQFVKHSKVWTVVSYDIPEQRHRIRDHLRSVLRQFGFIKWQHSVWITKNDCQQEIQKFVLDVGIDRWVKVYTASALE